MIEIIPAIDIIEGQCVRLTKGDYSQKSTYADDPAAVAMAYEDLGIKRLHVVDLDGAKCSAPRNLAVLERIASTTSLDVQWGGGVKSREALQMVLDAGARRVICGSVAVDHPELMGEWLAEFSPARIILGADVKDGAVATHGWLRSSQLTAADLIKHFALQGLSQTIVTDISRDGMLAGPNFELYDELQTKFPNIDITVSGGISAMGDIERLNQMGLRSVIVGKAIYEGRITLNELKRWLQNA